MECQGAIGPILKVDLLILSQQSIISRPRTWLQNLKAVSPGDSTNIDKAAFLGDLVQRLE